ncbi:MAG: rhodanese-like domain-containing protein [Bacteroidia bacterium]|nr:rhodanese-like domain-containing protein [Bacteroidia bacterium]
MDISVSEVKKRLDAGENLIMVDVRQPQEWEMQHLDGVIKISLGDLPDALGELAQYKDKEIVMICRSGGRSGQATQFLSANGFANVRNMSGGMLKWRAEVDPGFKVV